MHKLKIFKSGFTLAEVLITLVIVGVVAGMTIPTVIQNVHKKQVGVKLKKFYSVMSQALMRYYIDQGVDANSFEINEDAVGNDEKSLEWFNNTLGKYIVSIRQTKNVGSNIHYAVAFNDGSGFVSYVSSKSKVYFFYCTEYSKCTSEIYDGRKSFLFEIGNGKFQTFSWGLNRSDALNYCKNPSSYASGTASRRHACSRVIELDGWEIKDDYPWYPD